MIVSK